MADTAKLLTTKQAARILDVTVGGALKALAAANIKPVASLPNPGPHPAYLWSTDDVGALVYRREQEKAATMLVEREKKNARDRKRAHDVMEEDPEYTFVQQRMEQIAVELKVDISNTDRRVTSLDAVAAIEMEKSERKFKQAETRTASLRAWLMQTLSLVEGLCGELGDESRKAQVRRLRDDVKLGEQSTPSKPEALNGTSKAA